MMNDPLLKLWDSDSSPDSKREAERCILEENKTCLRVDDAPVHFFTAALNWVLRLGGPDDARDVREFWLRRKEPDIRNMAERVCERLLLKPPGFQVRRSSWPVPIRGPAVSSFSRPLDRVFFPADSNAHASSILHSSDASPEARLRALRELLDQDDPALPPILVTLLAGGDLAPDLRYSLLHATERVQFVERGDRSVLASSLLRHARAFLGAPRASDASQQTRQERAMWAALRRYGTLIPETENALEPFLEFLGAPHLPTQGVALQSLANVFSVSPPSASLDLTEIRDRVVHIARTALDPARPVSGEEDARARSAYVAAAALVVSPLEELTERAIALAQRWLLRQALQDLEPTLEAWRLSVSASGSSAPAIDAFARATARIKDGLSRLQEQKKGG